MVFVLRYGAEMYGSDNIKRLLRERLGQREVDQLKKILRKGQKAWVSVRYPRDLQRIGEVLEAGKHAWYYSIYEHHFSAIRTRALNVLEIGIGGYETSAAGGGSLRMWEAYFPHSRVFGVDIYDKTPHDAGRVRTFRGSQADESFMRNVVQSMGRLDVVIDDGSHINEHVITSFNILFPLLEDGGIYVIEDTQSSYWESFGGSSKDLQRSDTTMGFVKDLLDGLNHEELREPNRPSGPYDRWIVSVHCYHNIIFIEKGQNR
jgi:hypothetical protein